jgi:hypothetical protein
MTVHGLQEQKRKDVYAEVCKDAVDASIAAKRGEASHIERPPLHALARACVGADPGSPITTGKHASVQRFFLYVRTQELAENVMA